MALSLLSLLETRVLGVLVEKEKTVPDTYPLSLNALVAGCNQKNNRDPVMEATEAEVLVTVDALKAASWVIESSGARVARYEHNIGRVLRVPDQAVALLSVLMLRGPQTAAELRQGADRLHRFADTSSVEAFLDELAARDASQGGPLVVKLARAPGEREARWAHLLSGPWEAPASAVIERTRAVVDVEISEIAALKAQQARLGAELEALRARFDRLARELGIEL